MKTYLKVIILHLSLFITNVSFILSEELITNGTFDNNFSGFYSQYTLVNNPPWNMNGIYTTTSDPKIFFSGWMTFDDKSPSDNNLMFLNDAGNNIKSVLIGTNVAVKTNTKYVFSCWVASVHNLSPPNISISINNEFQISKQIPNKGGEWVNIKFEWCNSDFNNAKIEIFNLNPSLFGNDFVIDDLSFQETEPGSNTIIFEKADDVSICPKSSIEIGKYSNPDLQYTWSPIKYLNNTKIPNPICKPDSSIRYIVTITNNNCGKAFDTIDVIVHKTKKPEISASKIYICNDSTILVGNDGFVSYHWSTGDSGKLITVRKSGVYTLNVIDSNGCETSNLITILDKSSSFKVPEVFDVGKLCFGSIKSDFSFYIENSTTDTIYFERFELISGLEFFKLIDDNEPKNINPLSKYTFSIELLNLPIGKYHGFISYKTKGECSIEGKVLVEVEIIKFEIDLKDTIKTCSGSTINIGNDDISYNDYIWSPKTYLNDPYTSNPVCTPYKSMTYYVKVNNNVTGCNGFDTVHVVITNSEITINQQYNKCKDSLTLTANEGFVTYEWSNGDTSNSTVVDKSGKYFVRVLDTNGCVTIDTIDVIFRPNKVTISTSSIYLCQGPITLTASDGYEEYIWSTGHNGQSMIVDKAGQYKVIAIDSIGCTAESTYIVNDYDYNIEFPDTIDLGEICYGGMFIDVIYNFRNISNDTLRFDTLYFNSEYFGVTYDITKDIYPNSQLPFKINLLNLPFGQISGYLKFVLSYPCYKVDSIFVKANIIIQSLDLPDSLFVCLGSSLNIGVESDNPDYEYIWSPSDYLDNPNLSNPLSTPQSDLRYYVKRLDKSTGCIAFDTVDVLLYNSQIEISATALTVCQDPVELTASDGYQEYNWSNGKKGRIIKILEAGKYSVTAIDSNGCESYAEIEIGIHKINLEFTDKFDFGEICLGTKLSKDINIINIENEMVVIDSIHLINNANFQISIPIDNIDTLKQGDSYSFQVLSKFSNVGFHENGIRISLKYPCPAEYKIKLSANVLNNTVHIFLPDTTVFIGDSICIPVAAYSECPDTEVTANYSMTILVNKTLFKPDSVETGRIISITDLDKNFRIEFEDRTNTKTISTKMSIINYLCGLVTVGEIKSSDLHIDEFYFDNPITIIKHNGSITADLCEIDLRQIQMITPNKFEVLQNDYSEKIILNTGSGEEGNFSIKIMDLTGNTIFNHTWNKSNQIFEEKFIPVNSINFSQGLYMLIFQTPWSINTKKLLIVN